MKRICFTLLVFALTAVFCAALAERGGYIGEDNAIAWTFDEASGLLTFTGTGPMPDYAETDAPP